MHNSDFGVEGLSNSQVIESRSIFGSNTIHHHKENEFLNALSDLIKEPMFVLLLVAATVYFISGEFADGFFMVSAIILVATISLYQDSRSRNALAALKQLTQPKCKVIRSGTIIEISIEDVVLGDYCICEEGTTIPADGTIIQCNDFFVNESVLTGESFPVNKNVSEDNNKTYQGSWVTGGLAICKIEAIGSNTMLGKIGKAIENIKEEDSPLQVQIRHFVKLMAIAGAIVFIIVWVINYYHSHLFLDSLLKALTLAMSILPEEIPVAFTTFMALGAWRLMKIGVIVKQTKTVETLGSATVICTDKTGTITENKMKLEKIFTPGDRKIKNFENISTEEEKQLIRMAMWSSEPIPFDPMEIALHESYIKICPIDERSEYKMLHEYPLDGHPPMMTHIFENMAGERIIAAKGAPEAIISVSNLSDIEKEIVIQASNQMSEGGLRVLGVADSEYTITDFPEKQQHFNFNFRGLIAFQDPPKKNIPDVFEAFYKAGINVKIVTGDNSITTTAIAKQVNFKGLENPITGKELMNLSEKELEEKVLHTNIFTRMFPDAKLKIINALKAKGEIVAMTGDGVNDGPALKASHIGIAMGKKGTEIAKQASSLILTDDDLSKMVDAVAMGRKIYTNLKKAIQYIISIHIPIILTVLMPLVLGWKYPNIFSPVHVIFLELIMGPTCSIIYENEPMEKNTMLQNPRPFATRFFNWKELTTSIIQGLAITLGTLGIYKYAVFTENNESITRTMVFITLISANIFLTLVNRSFFYSFFSTLRYKNNLVYLVISITFFLTALILTLPYLTEFFRFKSLNTLQLLASVITGGISVVWYEIIKWVKRKKMGSLI